MEAIDEKKKEITETLVRDGRERSHTQNYHGFFFVVVVVVDVDKVGQSKLSLIAVGSQSVQTKTRL